MCLLAYLYVTLGIMQEFCVSFSQNMAKYFRICFVFMMQTKARNKQREKKAEQQEKYEAIKW